MKKIKGNDINRMNAENFNKLKKFIHGGSDDIRRVLTSFDAEYRLSGKHRIVIYCEDVKLDVERSPISNTNEYIKKLEAEVDKKNEDLKFIENDFSMFKNNENKKIKELKSENEKLKSELDNKTTNSEYIKQFNQVDAENQILRNQIDRKVVKSVDDEKLILDLENKIKTINEFTSGKFKFEGTPEAAAHSDFRL